jgi:hypothetical protein
VAGRHIETKSIVVIAVEMLSPKGFGRIRLRRVDDLTTDSLVGFICDVVEPGSVIITDGWNSYRPLPRHGYTHKRASLRAGDDPALVIQSGVHRAASLLKRWLLGTHQGAVRAEQCGAEHPLQEEEGQMGAHRPSGRGMPRAMPGLITSRWSRPAPGHS